MRRIKEQLHPVGDREVIVEQLGASWDFIECFSALGIGVHGHAGSNSNHVFTMCRRCDLFLGCHIEDDIQINDEGFADIEPHPHDAVLLLKQFMSSRSIAPNSHCFSCLVGLPLPAL